MKIKDLVKLPLRPAYRFLREKILRNRDKAVSLEQSYSMFAGLSSKKDIGSISFQEGVCVITLQDQRRYYFDPLDAVARMYTVPVTGTFEHKETDFLRRFIKTGGACFDVGASFGWYTVLLSKLVGPGGHVHAFEPLLHTFDILQRNLALNGCNNVTSNMVALDEKDGIEEIFLPDIGVSGSFRLHKYEKTFKKLQCHTMTLDRYCAVNQIVHIDFMKADIEGAELRLLKGGRETLSKCRPPLLLEVQGDSTRLFGYEPADIFEWLKSLGYSPHFVSSDGGLASLEKYDGELPDYNFMFLPER